MNERISSIGFDRLSLVFEFLLTLRKVIEILKIDLGKLVKVDLDQYLNLVQHHLEGKMELDIVRFLLHVVADQHIEDFVDVENFDLEVEVDSQHDLDLG